MKTFYEVLGIREDATIDEIEYAYEFQTKKVKRFIDDPEKGEKAKKRIKNLDVAYKILINISSRKAYDKDLENMRANEIMNNLQQNTNKYNEEQQILKEREEAKKRQALELKKKQENEKRLKELEERKAAQIKMVQDEIDKQIVGQQEAYEKNRKKQAEAEKRQEEALKQQAEALKQQEKLMKQQEKIEKEKIKVVKEYMKQNGMIKMPLSEKIFRAVVTIIIVIGILFLITQIPFVKDMFINNESMNFFLNLFEK